MGEREVVEPEGTESALSVRHVRQRKRKEKRGKRKEERKKERDQKRKEKREKRREREKREKRREKKREKKREKRRQERKREERGKVKERKPESVFVSICSDFGLCLDWKGSVSGPRAESLRKKKKYKPISLKWTR